jgi:hypothetical protein
VYTDEGVSRFITENFIPIRINAVEQKEDYQLVSKQFGVHWTPTILVVDREGLERQRIEGFVPADSLVTHLTMGLARSAFAQEKYDEAERLYREAMDRSPDGETAPEAAYWAGVTRYRKTGNRAILGTTGIELKRRYGSSSWAKKASIWLPEEAPAERR